jgi:hypothetical protein
LRWYDRKSAIEPDTTNKWTEVLIEIVNGAGDTLADHTVLLSTNKVIRHPETADRDFALGCRAAYNKLYSDTKVNFNRAFDIDPNS